MATERLALPAAYADPAFMQCLMTAIEEPDLVEQFDRLYQASLYERRSAIAQLVDDATGKTDHDIRRFVEFVHSYLYCRLSDEAIDAIRAAKKGD